MPKLRKKINYSILIKNNNNKKNPATKNITTRSSCSSRIKPSNQENKSSNQKLKPRSQQQKRKKKKKKKKKKKQRPNTNTDPDNQTQMKPRSQPKPKSLADPTTDPCSQHPHASLQNFPFPIVFTASRPYGLHDQNLEDQPLDLLAAGQYRVR